MAGVSSSFWGGRDLSHRLLDWFPILDGMNDRNNPRFRIQVELKSMVGKRYRVVVAGQ